MFGKTCDANIQKCKSMTFLKYMLGASLCICIAIACFIGATIYQSPSAQYKRHPEEVTLRQVLSTEVKRGDSRQYVVSLLGDGKPDDGQHLNKLLRYQASPHFEKRHFPDGVNEGDKFVFYAALPGEVYDLQFRDDALVNFDPSLYVGKNMLLDSLSGNGKGRTKR